MTDPAKTTVQTNPAIVGVASGQLLGPNPNRYAILIGQPRTNRITLSFGGLAVLGQGFDVLPSAPAALATFASPLLLTAAQIGTSIQQPIAAIADAAPETVGVTEFLKAP